MDHHTGALLFALLLGVLLAAAPHLRRVVLLHDAASDREAAAANLVGALSQRFIWLEARARQDRPGARHVVRGGGRHSRSKRVTSQIARAILVHRMA